jgi:hypothetical protein
VSFPRRVARNEGCAASTGWSPVSEQEVRQLTYQIE